MWARWMRLVFVTSKTCHNRAWVYDIRDPLGKVHLKRPGPLAPGEKIKRPGSTVGGGGVLMWLSCVGHGCLRMLLLPCFCRCCLAGLRMPFLGVLRQRDCSSLVVTRSKFQSDGATKITFWTRNQTLCTKHAFAQAPKWFYDHELQRVAT